jgi:tRNA modification GTPase
VIPDPFVPHTPNTIVAISTPPGRGGIGIVRLSGARSLAIAGTLLRPAKPLAPNHATLAKILGPSGETLDEALVTFFKGPHSYTSEDVVEIAAHGAPVLLAYLVEASIEAGARLAEPGEFTQRAFISGRLDLTQAEAVHDLIAAQTLHQARVAAAQLGGSTSQAIAPIKRDLITLIASLEAGVDFAEDDLDLLPEAEILRQLENIRDCLQTLAQTSAYGRIVRDGAKLAIVGLPNAGKSSLFNRLLQRERAIVTAHPGTTRDPISERLSLAGIPIELIDTAGLRDVPETPESEPERIGIARSRATLADADLVLHVLDASAPPHPEDLTLQASLTARPYLRVLNKSDLTSIPPETGAIATSALTGAGLDTLREAIIAQLAAAPPADSPILTNIRQSQAVSDALAALATALQAAATEIPHEFLLLDLHAALEALDRLTGATAPDDILSLIFSTFCIGK